MTVIVMRHYAFYLLDEVSIAHLRHAVNVSTVVIYVVHKLQVRL